MPTAFVFAGGGSLGAIQAGALAELIAAGERPDFVVGASVGALNACYFAGRPDAAGVAALEAIWRGLTRADVFPVTPGSVLEFLRGRGSLFGASGSSNFLSKSTAVAAGIFFVATLGLTFIGNHHTAQSGSVMDNLQVPAAPAQQAAPADGLE